MKAIHIIGILVVLVIIVGGAVLMSRPAQTATQNKEPIKLGGLFPLTGDVAQLGIPASQAVELAVEEANAAGGINGQKVEFYKEDGGCNPKDATSASTKLIEIDKVIAIIGGFCSGETLAAAPIAERNKVILFSPTSSNPKITEAGDFIFRSYPSDAFQGSYAADYTFKQKNAKKAAILYINNDWGNGIKVTFRSQFEKLGGTIVLEDTFDQSATDLRTQLTKIKSLNPDFVYFPAYPAETIIGLKQANELGMPATLFFGGDGAEDATIAGALGATGNGFMWVVPSTNPPQDFLERFKAKTGKEPSLGVVQAYDNAKILMDVISRVGTNSEAVKSELYNVKDYKGVSGMITIDSNGDLATVQYQLRIIKDGKMDNG